MSFTAGLSRVNCPSHGYWYIRDKVSDSGGVSRPALRCEHSLLPSALQTGPPGCRPIPSGDCICVHFPRSLLMMTGRSALLCSLCPDDHKHRGLSAFPTGKVPWWCCLLDLRACFRYNLIQLSVNNCMGQCLGFKVTAEDRPLGPALSS